MSKSISGLKQAANNWHKELANFLLRQGSKKEAKTIIAFLREQRHARSIRTETCSFLDFMLDQSEVRNLNAEVSRTMGKGCMRITIPSNKREFQCELNNVLCVTDYSSILLSVSKSLDLDITSLS